jgi:hypothetical protein
LVEALGSNENLKIVTFAYRTDNQDTHFADTLAVFEYLKNQGIDRVICVGAYPGAYACYGLKNEPEIIGMVLIASETPAIEANFPKLFLTADADPFGLAGSTQRAYEQSNLMLRVCMVQRFSPKQMWVRRCWLILRTLSMGL